MGSTRLPGKVLLPLGSGSIMTYLVDRLRPTESLDEVVVATSVEPRDDVIAEVSRRHHIFCFRGSEHDVLARYLDAADVTETDIIVRVTADNPFTDPSSIDRVVKHIVRTGADYVIENGLPVGTTGEALTRRLLTKLAETAHEPRWREHVTLYAKENPIETGGIFLTPPASCECPELSLTVDEPDDYLRVEEIARHLDGREFDLPALIRHAQHVHPLSVARQHVAVVSGLA